MVATGGTGAIMHPFAHANPRTHVNPPRSPSDSLGLLPVRAPGAATPPSAQLGADKTVVAGLSGDLQATVGPGDRGRPQPVSPESGPYE